MQKIHQQDKSGVRIRQQINLACRRYEVVLLLSLITKWTEIWQSGYYLPLGCNYDRVRNEVQKTLDFITDPSQLPPSISSTMSIVGPLSEMVKELSAASYDSIGIGPKPAFAAYFSSALSFTKLYRGCTIQHFNIQCVSPVSFQCTCPECADKSCLTFVDYSLCPDKCHCIHYILWKDERQAEKISFPRKDFIS